MAQLAAAQEGQFTVKTARLQQILEAIDWCLAG